MTTVMEMVRNPERALGLCNFRNATRKKERKKFKDGMFCGRWFLSEVRDDLIILVLTYLPMLNPRDETNESGNSDSTM